MTPVPGSCVETGREIKNPLCLFQTPCGRMAILGEPEIVGGSIHRSITAIGCTCHGAQVEMIGEKRSQQRKRHVA